MLWYKLFPFVATVTAGVISQSDITVKTVLDDFVTVETTRSYQGVLDNIGSNGAKASGASPGIVIASPSKTSPPYFYTWTRDAALVLKQLVQAWDIGGKSNATLQNIIEQYITAQSVLQQLDTPSGGPTTGGLGEPKFEVNETPFTGAWGRPQRDGPALRAVTLINYAKALQSTSTTLNSVISADLNYLVTYWNLTGFDLWEEVSGSSFFTIGHQYRALSQGYQLYNNTSFLDAANKLWCFFQSFYDSKNGYVISNINTNNGRTGKDANSLLTSIHLFDPEVGCDSSTFQPCSDQALSNHKVVVDSFRSIYGVNSGIPASQAVAIGRYPEDSYYNGNPWYLATAAAAEQLYYAIYSWNKLGSITITSVSLPFFQQIYSSAAVGTFPSSSSTFTDIISAVQSYADGFVTILSKYIPSDGSISEQFDKSTGTPLSAADLTWSYSAFLTLSQARSGVVPASWGALATSPDTSTCGSGNTGPGVQTTFNARATTVVGETAFVVGSIPELGSWNPANAIAMNADNYPIWSVTTSLPSSSQFEYKYIKTNSAGTVTWQVDPNNNAQLPASGTYTINDVVTWQ